MGFVLIFEYICYGGVWFLAVIEIDGLEEGLRRYNLEHGQRGGGEDNGVGEESD